MAQHLLVVEDDLDFRDELEQQLAGDGVEIHLAANGADAINHLEHGPRPHVLIVDLLMPGIVGHEVLDYLESHDELRTIPVAIISGAPELAPTGYQVFPKPLDIDALRAFVRSARASSPASC